MKKVDWLDVGPAMHDDGKRKELAQKMDFLSVGATLSDKDLRYALGRKIDIFDVGTPLGKNKFIQKIDFLEMFPKPGDMNYSRSHSTVGGHNKYNQELSLLRTSDDTGKLAYFYEHVHKALTENKQDICTSMNTIITYEVEAPRRNTLPTAPKMNSLVGGPVTRDNA